MASTFFQDYNQNNPIVSSWLNDVNALTYSAGGLAKLSLAIPVAWVRFSVTGGVVDIQQSIGIASVVRSGDGVFTINYINPLTNSDNCYQIASSIPGFSSYSAESASSVTINIGNTTDVPTDPGSCCVVVLGAN
jgi:hypothetical protein